MLKYATTKWVIVGAFDLPLLFGRHVAALVADGTTDIESGEAGRRLIRRATLENSGAVDDEGNHFIALDDSHVSIISTGDWAGSNQTTASWMTDKLDSQAPTPKVSCNTKDDAKPGSPRVDEYKVELTDFNPKIAALGDRLVKVAEADDAMRKCGSFFCYGDYCWCSRVMPAEIVAYTSANPLDGVWCNASGVAAAEIRGSLLQADRVAAADMVGLSYGIEDVDGWSELMSSQYHLPTRLYDCYVRSGLGPMFQDFHLDHSADKPCTTPKCYSMPYDYHRVCINNVSQVIDGYRFESLADHLQGRRPYSAFVKMDVEGFEWPTLDALSRDEDLQSKIRSLDLEIHLTFAGGLGYDMEKRVQVLERLKEKFAVTGSNIESMFRVAHQDFENKRVAEPTHKNTYDIYNSHGMPLVQYVMSFVNRDLL
eukprot:TRINITY_DN40661_c0_g1_i1.p1 TRINITY_DN40661_c0_g1~~TRINITY_DN40661_c0_g1_i1.p1  ORF type:complete len:425 (-),score=74.43 TRINITY_DN40661_c0_g1_i1:39-1313(-)